MAKITQQGRKQYETPQITPDQIGTPIVGGIAPSMDDVIRSANARSTQRHEMKGQQVADVNVLAESAMMAGNEMVGIKNNGYIAKKGLEYGVNALYNSLPPGMDIEDQELSDIREMQMVVYQGGVSFPGDGWTQRALGSQMPRAIDMGRPEMTNKIEPSKY